MDSLSNGLTVYKACYEINRIIFGENGNNVTDDNKDEMIHEEIDRYVTELWDYEVVSILYNFGLDKALQSYKDTFGEIYTIKAVVYHIIEKELPETDGYEGWK